MAESGYITSHQTRVKLVKALCLSASCVCSSKTLTEALETHEGFIHLG